MGSTWTLSMWGAREEACSMREDQIDLSRDDWERAHSVPKTTLFCRREQELRIFGPLFVN